MKNGIKLLFAALCAFSIAGCVTKADEAKQDMLAPTGYWYFSENGDRIWRTITPDNVRPPVQKAQKVYPTSFGNGSGR